MVKNYTGSAHKSVSMVKQSNTMVVHIKLAVRCLHGKTPSRLPHSKNHMPITLNMYTENVFTVYSTLILASKKFHTLEFIR